MDMCLPDNNHMIFMYSFFVHWWFARLHLNFFICIWNETIMAVAIKDRHDNVIKWEQF